MDHKKTATGPDEEMENLEESEEENGGDVEME